MEQRVARPAERRPAKRSTSFATASSGRRRWWAVADTLYALLALGLFAYGTRIAVAVFSSPFIRHDWTVVFSLFWPVFMFAVGGRTLWVVVLNRVDAVAVRRTRRLR